MTIIIATISPLWWAATNPNVIETGITHVGELTVSGLTLISDADENAYLGKLVGKVATYKPLPVTGWLEAGEIYGYGTGLVIIRQSHNRTLDLPADIPALISTYRAGGGVQEWVANEKVLKGTVRTYLTKTYTCIVEHVTQVDWTPDKTATLWTLVPVGTAWAYPVAYKVGDVVTHLGKSYSCLQSHNSQSGWSPPVVPALWKLL
jgi:hypothetical protein